MYTRVAQDAVPPRFRSTRADQSRIQPRWQYVAAALDSPTLCCALILLLGLVQLHSLSAPTPAVVLFERVISFVRLSLVRWWFTPHLPLHKP
mgnify:CR=1 FL=1